LAPTPSIEANATAASQDARRSAQPQSAANKQQTNNAVMLISFQSNNTT
jgi:hypothetical protein